MQDVEKATTVSSTENEAHAHELGASSYSKAGDVEAGQAGSIKSMGEEHLRRALSSRQISMIAIGGTIGTGLFLGTGRSLANGGPGSLLITYTIIGAIVLLVMQCLGEMAAEFPLAGAFTTYSARFVDDAFGFTIGWNYAFNDAVSMAGDLTAAQVLMDYWLPGGSHNWVPSLVFFFALVGINMFHVRAYGELEYWLSLLKVATICAFIIIGIVVNVGGNVNHEYIGARNWTKGAAPFVSGFRGFASLFVTASFAFGGTESIAVTSGETKNPRRNIPRVIRRVWARIVLFYLLTVTIIGFNVAYDTPNLKKKSTQTSPFTLMFAQVGSKSAGSFMNAVIMTSVISAGNHALFAGSRVLYGLAVIKQAPAVFKRTNRNQVPWVAVLGISSVSLIFFGASFLPGSANEIFTWAQNLVGVSNQLAWLCIGVASYRFRKAWKAQGRSVSELHYPAPVWAAPVVIVSVTFIILVQGWSSLAPFSGVDFVANYIELPVFGLLYIVWRLVKRVKTPTLQQIDLDTSRWHDTAVEEADNLEIATREGGKFGWAWKAYSWVA